VEVFRYPITPPPRTAVLVGWFSSGRFGRRILGPQSIRVFRNGWGPDAAAFAPAAIAATWDQLRSLKAAAVPSLTHAMIVLWRPGQGRLTESDRDRLWDEFRVPVFEQVIGKSGELLAAECEAHDGLHLESSRLPTDNEYVDASPCPCGRKTSRIGGTQGGALLRRIAAYAR
jgi:hypothetical protein